jgi:hypothetical protein
LDTLFYVFDLGEGLAVPFGKILAPLPARLVAQLVSFGVNAALWAGFAVGVAKLVSLVI